jgi:putative membrane protein
MMNPMPEGLVKFLQRWLVTTIGVLLADVWVDGIRYQTFGALLEASLLLGLLNAFVRPLLMVISLPLLIFSLGLFVMVINAVLLSLVGGMLQPGFVVDGFGSAFWGGVIISLVSLVVNGFLGRGAKVQFQGSVRGSSGRRRPKKQDEDGGGPLIDV